MFKVRSVAAILIFILFHCAGSGFGQALVAEVTVTTDKLPQEHRNLLMNLKNLTETYINSQEWAPDEYGYDVYLDMEIVFEKAQAVSFENRYSAVIVVSNRKDAQFSDKRWDFSLEPGKNLVYSPEFDPYRSLIDYYIQVVLGYEFDKVKKFGGNPYFEKARQICQAASFSSRYFNGWDKRLNQLENYLKKENEHFRYLNYLYYTGEWLYYEERDRQEAKKYLLYAIKQLDKVPKDRLNRFFDLNYYNFANALAEYGDTKSLTRIASLDPDHADLYERLLK